MLEGILINRLLGQFYPGVCDQGWEHYVLHEASCATGAETALSQILLGAGSHNVLLTRCPLTEFVRLQRIRVNSKTLNSINSEDYTRRVTQRVNLVTKASR